MLRGERRVKVFRQSAEYGMRLFITGMRDADEQNKSTQETRQCSVHSDAPSLFQAAIIQILLYIVIRFWMRNWDRIAISYWK